MDFCSINNRCISLKEIISQFNLEIINEGDFSLNITSPNLYIIGYELTGFFEKDSEELNSYINICGDIELNFINNLSKEERIDILEKYFSFNFPALIIFTTSEIPIEIKEIAKKYKKNIFKSHFSKDNNVRELKFFLSNKIYIEEVYSNYSLLEIHGIGVMLSGDIDSKIGITVELLERGHRIITDNNVIVKRLGENNLEGRNRLIKSAEYKNHFFLEIKSGKNIDVSEYFGIKSTRKNKRIDMLIVLEKWDEKKFYDRLGLDEEFEKFSGENIQKITLPVRVGRNLAVIIETAALNYRLKKMGVNSAEYFLKESAKLISENEIKRGENKMENFKKIPLIKLKNNFELKVLNGEDKLEDTFITSTSIFRPSLALAGYTNLYSKEEERAIQVFSHVEFNFLASFSMEERIVYLENYLSLKFPLIVLTQDIEEIPEYFMKLIKEHDIILCQSKYRRSAQLVANFNSYLETISSPSVTVHGVFVELYGFGVLLTGKSGIGKSETALELIHKGHRLVADDYVKFVKDPQNEVMGKSARIPYFMEIRGLGIIDIKSLYGISAVRIIKRLDLIIELKEHDSNRYTTSLSYSKSSEDILGEKIDKATLFISSGRNAAAMVEIAVMNQMANKLGHDSDKIFKEKLKKIKEEYIIDERG